MDLIFQSLLSFKKNNSVMYYNFKDKCFRYYFCEDKIISSIIFSKIIPYFASFFTEMRKYKNERGENKKKKQNAV